MPEPTGPGYQAPPGLLPVVEGERLQSVEDFLSRRVKAKYGLNTSFSVPSGVAGGVIPWDFQWYDTSGLYPQNDGYFVIPPGADGDYLVICQASIVNTTTTAYATRIAIRVREVGWSENSFRTLGQGYVHTAGDPELNVTGEYTLRAGDRIFAFFQPGERLALSVQGSVNDSFISLRRMV